MRRWRLRPQLRPPNRRKGGSDMAPASTTSESAPSFGDPGRRAFGYSPFLPLLLLVVAAVAWPAFQCYQLLIEKPTLATGFRNQTPQVEDAGEIRTSLDSPGRATA